MPQSHFFARSADGTEIFASEQGRGHPIVVVHGGLGEAAHWDPVNSRLADRYRLVGIERRLYGHSGPPQSPHSMAREAEDVAAVLAKLGEPAIVVGHSSGAVVSLEAALLHPPELAGLVLYEPPVQAGSPIGGKAQGEAEAALAKGDADTALLIFFSRIVGFDDAMIARMRSPMWRGGWEYMMGVIPAQLEDNRAIRALPLDIERYRSVDVPALLLRGTDSPKHLHDRLDALTKLLGDKHEYEIVGEGHNANMSSPDVLAPVIAEFAAEVFD